jgi:FixJ family two-component response regulator
LYDASLIAVVDDDRFVRESLERLLGSLGYVVEAFGSAAQYLASGRPARTACLIADIHMPEMTGLELHAQLLASGHNVPTILITAYPDAAAKADALNDGAVGYLAKPFREGELIAAVRSALEARGRVEDAS